MEIKKQFLTAEKYLEDTWQLAAMVRRTPWRPDLLIALWRGGAPVGVAVHEFLRATNWDVRHIPLKCASYTGIGENAGEVAFTLGEEVFAMIRPGEKVLVLDDVFDTGKTARAVKERIEHAGAQMRIATVYWKPSNNTTELTPDYFVEDVGENWLVFPHEIEGLAEQDIAVKSPLLSRLLRDVVR